MTLADRVVRHAMRNPSPANSTHTDGHAIRYVCHTAAIHWVVQAMAHDRSHALGYWNMLSARTRSRYYNANALVGGPTAPSGTRSALLVARSINVAHAWITAFTRDGCGACRGDPEIPGHHSIPPDWYGERFYAPCPGTTGPYTTPQGLLADAALQPGDIIVRGDARFPVHSMVCVRRTATSILIRGFNNPGTFQRGKQFEYDNRSIELTNTQYWQPGGLGGEPVSRIPPQDFADATVMAMLQLHT